MTILPLILVGVIIGCVGYWVFQYYRANGTRVDRLFAIFHSSATIVVARVSALVSLISGVLINWAGDPAIQEWLKGALSPKYSWAVIFVLMVIVELARYRSMEGDD